MKEAKKEVRLIKVRVTPGAPRQQMRMHNDGRFVIKVKSPPLKNRANQELCELLASHFGVPTSAVRIINGHHSRNKTIAITV